MFNSPMLLDFNSSTQQKRSKITKACDNCRRRRVKCDGVPDGCSGCKAAKTQCVYTTSNTKRGPPKGYVEVIEDRLGKIENMLTSIVRKKKNTLPEASSSSSTDKATVSSSTAASASHTSQNNEDNEDSHDEDEDDGCASTYSNDLVKVKQQPASPALRPARSSTPSSRNIRSGSVAMSPLGRHSPLISRNHSITSLLPFSHDVLPHHSSQNDSSLVTNADIASLTSMFDKLGSTSVRTTVPFPWLGPEQSLQYGRNHLQFTLQSLEPSLPILTRSFTPTISPEQTLQLIESFFERFNIYLPIIHRPTFMKQWEQQNCPLCPQTPSSHPRNRPAQAEDIEAHNQHSQDPAAPISPLLLNALLAVAAKVPSTNSVTLEDRQHSGFLSQSFFDAARLLLDDFMDVPRVSTVQALCLMSQYHHQGQWKATRSSSYLSMAIRMAHELGLNRDPENIISGPEADGLRYLWWSMFILDHQFSSWLGLGLMMHDKESDVELPMAPTSSQQDLRGFICMVRLVKILGSVLQHSYSAQSLPPQFGGHDSMVSFIEGSLSSWLSNLAPEMRWQNPNVSKRGSPGSPLRSPPSIQASLAEANRAVALAKEAGEVYPAYLYIVYNTTLILLHRPYIVGAAGSPAAAQSNTICTGSGRAITDIAQGLDMEQCSYVVNRFALFALLQAGVIHAMNAVYDKRGSQVAMDYYKRTLNVLESFLNCSSYSGGVLEGIKILEQFLATTSQAAAEDEINQGGENMVQQESDALPSRKRRQFEAVPSMSQHSTTSVQYTPTLTRTLPISSMPQHIMTPTFSMMTSTTSDVTNGAINAPQLIYNLVAQQQQQQQQQQLTLDLKEQQKQQQLKIQQQHRLYQQMQTFGASVLNKPSEIKTESLLEQQQLQQQQLMRQQLQRQQQRQQSDMGMKEQDPNTSQSQSVLNTMTAPVIPSHRYALQMLQQQQQQQQQQHGHHNMPMTMTDLSMEAQQKMGQEQLGMGPMASTMTDGFDYDPTKFWIDFTDSGSNGTLNPAHIQQQDPSIASSRSMVEPQLSGSLWM